jgi:hypothetical protein
MDPLHTVHFLGLSIKDDTVFTVFITLTVFFIGLLGQYLKSWYDERKRLQEVESLLKTFISLLEEPVKKQAKSMIEYSESLNRKRIEDLFAQDIMDLNINRIKDLPPIDLYKALLLKKKHKEKGKLFETIFRGVEFIDQIKISFKDDFNYILTNFKKYDESFFSNSENVARWYDSLVTNTKPDDLLKDKFFTDFFRIVSYMG